MFRIQTFGGVTLRDGADQLIRLRSRKHLALLLYMAASGRRVYTRDTLCSLLWSSAPARARHSLSQALYDLRRHLDGALVRGPGDELRMDRSKISLDAAQFEAALRQGDLARAVELYGGPFGDNLVRAGTDDFDRWLEGERLRLARLAHLALRRYTRECDEAGRWGEMCVAALKLVRMSTLDEEAHRVLMRGLWMHGDSASALAHFEEVAPILDRELPDGLSEETLSLARRIKSAPSAFQRSTALPFEVPPMLGRERELDLLRSAVKEIGRTPTTAIVVSGEGGIGKTRLVREFARSIGLEDLHLLDSRCYPAEADVPYGSVVDGIQPLAAQIAREQVAEARRFTRLGYLLSDFEHLAKPEEESVEPAAWRRRLYEEVASLVRVALRERPIVWIVEDIQWMDATSASLFHYVTRRLEGSPFLLVATLRVPRGADLPERLPVTPPGPNGLTSTIHLNPLTSAQIRELLRHVRPDMASHPAAELAERLSSGNPFFALEVLRAAVGSSDWAERASDWDPLTDKRLSKVLAIRLEGLSALALRVLQAVAVLERHATPGGVARVAGVPLHEAADGSDELYRRGLLHDQEGRLEFVNDILREYVYAGVSAMQRAALHVTAARYLSAEALASSATLARHYNLGEDRARTYECALEAAREADGAGGQREAAIMAELALQAARTREEKLAALHLLAEAELESAQLTSAREHFDQILRLDTDMSVERRIEVKLRIVEALGESSRWSEGRDILAGVAREIKTIPDTSMKMFTRAESLLWSLRIAVRQNDAAAARDVARCVADLETEGLLEGPVAADARASIALCRAAYAAFFQSSAQAIQTLSQIEPLLHSVRPELAERVHLFRGLVQLRMGKWDEGEYEIKKALALAGKRNDLVRLTSLWNNLACCALEQGDWAAFEDSLSRAEDIQQSLPDPLDAALPLTINRANSLFYQGRAAEAGDVYRRALNLATTVGSVEFVPELLACQGLVGLQLGNTDYVEDSWAALERVTEEQLVGSQERFKFEWFRAFMLRGSEPEDALSHLLRVAEQQRALDVPSHLKLLWLGGLLFNSWGGGGNASESGVEGRLRTGGVGWFVRFSKRWLRMSLGR